MTDIRDVEIGAVLGRLRNGKRFHHKAPQATGYTIEEAIGFDQHAPEGEELLTPEDMPTEAEIIAEWVAMRQPAPALPTLAERLEAVEAVLLEQLLGGVE